MNTLSDQELINRSKSGDHAAFAEIVKRYQSYVATIAMNMIGDWNESEEIGQQTFVRLYRSLHQFRGRSSLKTYISKICMNQSLTYLKRKQKQVKKFASLDQLESDQIKTESTESELINKDLLRRALLALDPQARMIINMRMIQEYSTKETAAVLGIAEGTVMSRLKRAMDKLKDIIK